MRISIYVILRNLLPHFKAQNTLNILPISSPCKSVVPTSSSGGGQVEQRSFEECRSPLFLLYSGWLEPFIRQKTPERSQGQIQELVHY